MPVNDPSRRHFVKRGAYVAPAILTLAAAPQFAKAGSVKPGNNGNPNPGNNGNNGNDGSNPGNNGNGNGYGYGNGKKP